MWAGVKMCLVLKLVWGKRGKKTDKRGISYGPVEKGSGNQERVEIALGPLAEGDPEGKKMGK